MSLSPADAAALYRKGMSACEIAVAHRITRQGAEARIRAGGLGGVQWCAIHRTHEELHLSNAGAVSYMVARQRATTTPKWEQAVLPLGAS